MIFNFHIYSLADFHNADHIFHIDTSINIIYIQNILKIFPFGLVTTLLVHLTNNDIQVSIKCTNNTSFKYLKSIGLLNHKHVQIPNTNVVISLL